MNEDERENLILQECRRQECRRQECRRQGGTSTLQDIKHAAMTKVRLTCVLLTAEIGVGNNYGEVKS